MVEIIPKNFLNLKNNKESTRTYFFKTNTNSYATQKFS